MINNKIRLEAVVLTVLLIGAMFLVPASSVQITKNEDDAFQNIEPSLKESNDNEKNIEFLIPDRSYYVSEYSPKQTRSNDNDDAGYKRDARNSIDKADRIYPGEMIDDLPGRGRTAKLSSSSDEDWYCFSVCEGQGIQITMTPPAGFDYDLSLWDDGEKERDNSTNAGSVQESIIFTANRTGSWYMRVHHIDGSGEGRYFFDIALEGQNDADTSDDAGDGFADATLITPGKYYGYLDMNDENDWYKFQVNDGDGIHFNLIMKTRFTDHDFELAELSDFDISLYKPSGELVHEENYYYNDELLYPVNEDGEWRVKIDIFPGYTDIPQPTDWYYYTYGSGVYELEFIIEDDAPAPPGPIPQPQITPIAKTFKIVNDPESNRDEYGYLASIPACNYLEEGERFLAPIIYEGDDTSTNYYGTDADRGTVDDTTQYLVDDWNDYLALHDKTATQYAVPADPIKAAADIATEFWESSDLAVVAVDGSGYEDDVKTALSRTRTLKRNVKVLEIESDSDELQKPMFIGPRWGAIHVAVPNITISSPLYSGSFLNKIFPNYMPLSDDFWPTPYDTAGDSVDIFYPITTTGIWTVGSGVPTNKWDVLQITKYACHRYRILVRDPDSVINVKVETDEPSDILVFLVDPKGNLRAPDPPQWNGPVMPIHHWNGFHNETGFDDWRTWDPEPHTEFSAEVLHPEKGLWTAIVVPRHAEGPDITYDITGEITTTNPDRADAAISAANAAVIASQEHVPLLYVTEDSVPSETVAVFNDLGVNKVIFVERGGIGSSVKDDLPTLEADLTTMQEIISHIKEYPTSENYITITSIKSGDGYFAPAAMLAAYHGSPVLRIGDSPGNPAAVADRIETWRLWDGDYYHGSRTAGHLPIASVPMNISKLEFLHEMIKFLLSGGVNGDLPPFGRDAKRYWNEELHDGIHDWIEDFDLDLEGQEGYCVVAPRKDIYLPVHSVMMGNNSYAGHIVGETPSYTSAMVVRNLLYPALIFANPNRNITTAQMMNFPDIKGNYNSWTTNDGVTHTAIYSSYEVKRSFSSHFRKFEGHCLWNAHLQRMNEGASVMYYSGHGTGGSGISAQYLQTEHCDYPDQIWWDAWRGYQPDEWGIMSTTEAAMPRDDGFRWYNAKPPDLYDIIHYDYVDELTENLRSNAIFYMSCTTADAFGPMVYLDHGAVIFYGNAGSGLCPEADLQDDEFFKDTMIYGEPIGPAYSKQVWLHFRDFTTSDNTSMYGPSSEHVTTVQCIYGDPNLIVYSPEWTSPEPVDA